MSIKKYIHLFQDEEGVSTHSQSENYRIPYVSYSKDERLVRYNLTENCELNFRFINTGNILFKASSSSYTKTIKYSYDKVTWISVTSSVNGVSIPVTSDKVIYIKGTNSAYSDGTNYNYFDFNSLSVSLQGNIFSLVNEDSFFEVSSMSENAFKKLFYNCSTITSINKLSIPFYETNNSCYESMFENCTSLVTLPKEYNFLSAHENSYKKMFSGCTSIINTPKLNCLCADISSFEEMFSNCTSLRSTVIEINETASSSYKKMFYNCSSLNINDKSKFNCQELSTSCYESMFENTGISFAPNLPATTLVSSCYKKMFKDCSNLPSGGEISCSTLAASCFEEMFMNCLLLSEVTMSSLTPLSSTYSTNWLTNVNPTGTFHKNNNLSIENIPINSGNVNYGIPIGWIFVEMTNFVQQESLSLASNEYVEIGIINPDNKQMPQLNGDGIQNGYIQVEFNLTSSYSFPSDKVILKNLTKNNTFGGDGYYPCLNGNYLYDTTGTVNNTRSYLQILRSLNTTNATNNNAIWLKTYQNSYTYKYRWSQGSQPYDMTTDFWIVGSNSGNSSITIPIKFIGLAPLNEDYTSQITVYLYPYVCQYTGKKRFMSEDGNYIFDVKSY